MRKEDKEIEYQREYYIKTADKYNDIHLDKTGEHFLSLSFMVAVLDYLDIKSIIDIGSGTGRAVLYVKEKKPGIYIIGIEPVKELREIGYNQGLLNKDLIEGDARKLQFEDGEFDLACEFGALHHIKTPSIVVSEMLRIARKAIFISDSNNFGQGPLFSRLLKQSLDFMGLWKIADFIKTRGRGYCISDGDGLAYSYSVFNNYRQIKKQCKSIHILNTQNSKINPYRSSGHIALLGIKKL